MRKIAPWFLCFGLLLVLVGCSKDKPTPQERLQAYVDDWQQQDFASMYKRLSDKSQKQISQKDFVNRYKKIYDDFDVHDLSIKSASKDDDIDPDEDKNVQLPFQIKMKTMAGPVKFSEKASLTQEEHEEDEADWFVDWNAKMIFPQMKDPDTKVYSDTLEAKRGEIIDRNGKSLAANGTVTSIGIWPVKLEDGSKKKLSEATGLSMKKINKKLDASWVKENSFVPVTKLSADNKKQIDQLTQIPGVQQQEETSRVYPIHKAGGPLTGYIGGINADQLKKLKDKGYDKNDTLGQAGLEKYYEDRLRGQDGAEIYTADEDGDKLETIAKREPKNGKTLQLTIDSALQKKLYKAMKNKDGKMDAGTATAINPKNGQVLALISTPTFDPNDFILGMKDKKWDTLQSNPKNPLLNRFAESYAPGSAFKPITAAIALQTDSIDPQKERKISGDTWRPKDHSAWGDYKVTRVNSTPSVNLEKALVYSDNIYFAQTALKIGADKFLEHGKDFGLGEKSSFPYPIEASKLTNGDKFDSEVQLANSGYGQGKVAVSALQLAIDYTPFLNKGDILKPSLELKKAKHGANTRHKNIISADNANRIKKDLTKVVSKDGGTAHDADIKGLSIAGKTGTAELKKSKDEKHGAENGWFIGFNTKDPKLLIAMMVENVQDTKPRGSHYVVPKVTDVLEEYLK